MVTLTLIRRGQIQICTILATVLFAGSPGDLLSVPVETANSNSIRPSGRVPKARTLTREMWSGRQAGKTQKAPQSSAPAIPGESFSGLRFSVATEPAVIRNEITLSDPHNIAPRTRAPPSQLAFASNRHSSFGSE